ncbi:PepSY-like domain-containing protein [Mucilaginibacter sp. L3T2-6]|uniref:PepSY-like domain-containing protein n=1 Tax=Mucilaginibacter sp. L3T2-6 TaxID=3062491 RepID=UPI00267743D8|nr:PepSY-like domain-containing protein [Mucilaginibacter sp. L3T2-6]MDO3641327.1 PepSY-like domain-containing protein [Mucilaginibacter sp. L3T2-6]MDV6213912.1 PepSY-like domain-containing protein [Mucilaginibacter sp. L3T2-6]
MKRIILLSVLAGGMLATTSVLAQRVKKSEVPEAVLSSLSKKYPQAAKVTWEKEKGNFEANWGGKSGEDMSVQFTPAGQFIEEVHAIPTSSLPAGVAAYVKSHFKKARISEAGKVTDAQGKTRYEAEIQGKDMLFDENGNFLKKEEE